MKKFVVALVMVLCVASVCDAGCIFGGIRARAQNRRQNGLGANLRGEGEVYYEKTFRRGVCANGTCR